MLSQDGLRRKNKTELIGIICQQKIDCLTRHGNPTGQCVLVNGNRKGKKAVIKIGYPKNFNFKPTIPVIARLFSQSKKTQIIILYSLTPERYVNRIILPSTYGIQKPLLLERCQYPFLAMPIQKLPTYYPELQIDLLSNPPVDWKISDVSLDTANDIGMNI